MAGKPGRDQVNHGLGVHDPELTVRVQCIVYAERQETEIRAKVLNADTKDLQLAPGIVKLLREQFFADPKAGTFGSWGWQQSAIGEIGMGLIVSPGAVVNVIDLPEERRVRCRLNGDGELRYWAIGDWQRGRPHPVAPTIDNWRQELHELAGELLNDFTISIGEPVKRLTLP